MQFNNLIALLTLAMTASALPAADAASNAAVARSGGGGGGGGDGNNSCNNNNQAVCCPGLLGGLLCTVGLVSGQCDGEAYCCNTNAPLGSLIVINLLNCVDLL